MLNSLVHLDRRSAFEEFWVSAAVVARRHRSPVAFPRSFFIITIFTSSLHWVTHFKETTGAFACMPLHCQRMLIYNILPNTEWRRQINILNFLNRTKCSSYRKKRNKSWRQLRCRPPQGRLVTQLYESTLPSVLQSRTTRFFTVSMLNITILQYLKHK